MAKAVPATGPLTTAAVRAIQALGTAPTGRADQIADRLAEAIRLGLLAPGERLPAEAALSEQLGVATLTLREALASLRERGLVTTRRGRSGGSFVAGAVAPTSPPSSPSPLSPAASASSASLISPGATDLPAGAAEPNAVAAPPTPRTPPLASVLEASTLRRLSELGDLRRATFATAASLAAERATAPEIDALHRRAERLAAARTPGERRRADGEFAVELAATAQSPRLAQDEANLRAELGDLVWTLLSDAEHAEVVSARRTLVDAVAKSDAEAAAHLARQQVAQETELLLRRRLDIYRADSTSAADGWSTLAGDIERIFEALTSTAAAFAASYADARSSSRATSRGYALADLALLRPRIHATLDTFQDLAVGTGIVVAPGILNDAAYWLEWWWRQPGGAPESLRVNLDPDGPDFFDYVNNEWFDVPVKTKRRHVAGPYVDYACSNQYTFTLSVPVFHKGKPLGVAAMDVPCDQIERRLMPALCADPTPRALLNPHGRLIASAALPPRQPPAAAATPRRSRTTPHVPRALARLCTLTGWTVVPA